MILQIKDKSEKQRICREILEALPEWFEVEESRERYISECADRIFIAAEENGRYSGFLVLKVTGNATIEIAVMGVLKDFHRQGIGKKLVAMAKDTARELGYSFMQVKTVAMGKYPDYDQTNQFYIGCGFKEFEVSPLLWDEANPCQIYIMSL